MSDLSPEGIADHLANLPDDQRAAYLERLYTSVDAAATEFDLPRRYPVAPTTIAATDTRTRREIWTPRLAGHPHFEAMPEPVREHILHIVVSVESDFIDARLDDQWQELSEERGTWSWDSTFATASHDGDGLEPPRAPDLDVHVAAAEARVQALFDDTIGLAVRGYVSHELNVRQMRGWTIDVQETPGEGPAWQIDNDSQHVRLSSDLHQPTTWKPLSETEVANFPAIVSALIAAPDPTAAAFPQKAVSEGIDYIVVDESAAVAFAPTEGPVR